MPWEKGSGHADEKVCYKPGFICVYPFFNFRFSGTSAAITNENWTLIKGNVGLTLSPRLTKFLRQGDTSLGSY